MSSKFYMEMRDKMEKDCHYFAPLITGLIDNELDAAHLQEVTQHLEKCPDCKHQYVTEMDLKAIVKERFTFFKAPSYLQPRIRRQLVRNGETPSFWELLHSLFIYRPAAASFALALIAFLVVFPTYQMVAEQTRLHKIQVVEQISEAGVLEGQIICIDCEFAPKQNGAPKHDPATHRSGLKMVDGTVWSFIHTAASDDLLHNPKYLRKEAKIYGTVFTNSHFVYVKKFEVL